MDSDPAISGPSPGDADVWARFMAAALMAAPHAPADKLATAADEALVEYRKRWASGESLSEGAAATEKAGVAPQPSMPAESESPFSPSEETAGS